MKSIKSKIVFVTISLLFAFSLVIISAAIMAFYHDKELLIAENNAQITSFEGQMNTEIAELEKNALDLALIGEIYFQKGKQKDVGEFFTQKIIFSDCKWDKAWLIIKQQELNSCCFIG